MQDRSSGVAITQFMTPTALDAFGERVDLILRGGLVHLPFQLPTAKLRPSAASIYAGGCGRTDELASSKSRLWQRRTLPQRSR